MSPRVRAWTRASAGLGVALALSGCSPEKRALGPDAPVGPPAGPADPRQAFYATNIYQRSEGGRLFRWIGCDQCHGEGAPGFRNLADDTWRRGGTVPQIYAAIAAGSPAHTPPYAGRLTPQNLWQLAGYVHGLKEIKPGLRRRNASAQQGEPSGAGWSGALR